MSTNTPNTEIRWATRWREAAQRPVGPLQWSRRLARDTVISAKALTHRSWQDRFLRCLFCHYVFDDQVDAFRRVIAELSRDARFIDTGTLLAMLAGASPIDGRCFHLSFDDGFRNNLTNAGPVLKEFGIRAAFFVPSAVIGADGAATRDYCRRINYPAPIEMMTWTDLETLRDAGHEIGSHTRTHARFSDISRDRAKLEDEIAGSKREIESRLGVPCRTISWPFGKRSDADDPSLKAAKAAGYAACFGAYRGSVQPGVTDPFSVPRHHFEAEWPMLHIGYFARGNMEAQATR